jgi:5-methylcytosine-specific restriction endonuclease McrA
MSRFRNEYPVNWPEIAARVKAEAGGKCVRCGHLHQPEVGYCLTVHHLDGDKANGAWWNLLALCQRCHLRVQARVIVERQWLLEHTEWFKPYAAGFYASYYGGVHPTREEVEADVDRFLAMGQPHLYVVRS